MNARAKEVQQVNHRLWHFVACNFPIDTVFRRSCRYVHHNVYTFHKETKGATSDLQVQQMDSDTQL